jgi:glycosyltransferase involved in cell wall biosynthesis
VDERSGIIAKNKDSKSLADAAVYLMDNPEVNLQYRIQAHSKSAEYSWEHVARLMLEQYKEWFA